MKPDPTDATNATQVTDTINTGTQSAQRTSSKWTALVLVLVALGFFCAVIFNRWYVG